MTALIRPLTLQEFERAAHPIISPFRSQFGAVWFSEATKARPKREWHVHDLILARSFGVVYGPPGSGKSFLISDLTLTCSLAALRSSQEGETWFGHGVKPVGVVYIVAEGADDFVIRLHAWRMENGIAPDAELPFVFLPTSINLMGGTLTDRDSDISMLREEIRAIDAEMQVRCSVGVGMVVVDTVSRALAGGNENDSQVMGTFVRNCEALQKALQISVLCVHHGGKEGGRGPRGHESLKGAADYVWEVRPPVDDAPRQWVIEKFKAGAPGAHFPFILRPLLVDEDEDGDRIVSCVVEQRRATDTPPESDRAYKATAAEIEFLRVLHDALGEHGWPPAPSLSLPLSVGLVVGVDQVKALYRQRYAVTGLADDEADERALAGRWKQAVRRLISNGVIASAAPHLWLTGRPVRGFAPSPLPEPHDGSSPAAPDDSILEGL